jgi:hypothetical protein
VLLLAAALGAPAAADVPEYQLVGSFPVPAGAWDLMPDGRVAVMDGAQIRAQDSLNGSTYSLIGSVDPAAISSFGASFLRFSPDGSRLAIGDNNFGPGASVLILNVAALSPGAASPYDAVSAPNSDAFWTSSSTLFVNGFGASSQLVRVDADALAATTVVENIGQGTGGVVSDGTYLYQGIGFDTSAGGAPTGEVRAFPLADLLVATAPVDFGAGVLVADALSGSPLGLDAFGDLLIGGGDFFAGSNDFGYAAVVDADAVALALAGGPVAPDSAELRLSPAGAGAPYSIAFNEVTQELLVLAEGTAYRYAVPAPAGAVLFAAAGAVALGRRRR